MSYPYWLDDDGRALEMGEPYSQHVRDYYHYVSLERMRSYRAELSHHKDAKLAKQCLSFGGCVSPCDFFLSDRLTQLAELSAIAEQVMAESRDGFLGAVPVTPPLCLIGETFPPKSIKKYTDHWRAKNAN